MKKKLLQICVIILLGFTNFKANAQTYHWAFNAGGTNADTPTSLATDSDGNAYLLSTYDRNAAYGSASTNYSVANAGNYILSKTDPQGNLLWHIEIPVKQSAGVYTVHGSITLDEQKNIYLIGENRSIPNNLPESLHFTVNGVTFNNYVSSAQKAFVMKINTDGTPQWIVLEEGFLNTDGQTVYPLNFRFTGIKVSQKTGDILVTGHQSQYHVNIGGKTIDDEIQDPWHVYPPSSFLVRLDNTGNVKWIRSVKEANGTRIMSGANHIYEDLAGNIYVAGQNNSNIAASSGIFLAKFAEDGNHLWSRINYNPLTDETSRAIALHGNGTDKVYLYYSNKDHQLHDFGGGGATFQDDTDVHKNGYTGYHSIFNPDGVALSIKNFPFVNRTPITQAEGVLFEVNSCLYEDNGDFYLAGDVTGEHTLNNGSTLESARGLNNAFSRDALVLHFDADFSTVKHFMSQTGTHSESGQLIAKGADDKIILAGIYNSYSHPFFGSFGAKFGDFSFMSKGGFDIFMVAYTPTPNTTPVTLIGYVAKPQGNTAKLTWQTASESNNSHFAVRRSTDGINFTEIATVKAKSASGAFYQYIDNNPANGTNYYQLLQVDLDGKTTDLGIRTVGFELSLPTGRQAAFSVQLFPNPVKDIVNIHFNAGVYHTAEIADVSGKILQSTALNIVQQSIAIDVSAYASGIYTVRLKGDAGNEVKKIVKE